jgi:hypothetical protein
MGNARVSCGAVVDSADVDNINYDDCHNRQSGGLRVSINDIQVEECDVFDAFVA